MTPLDTALSYAARGWCPIPIPHMQKGPKLKGWPGLRITDKNAQDYFNGAAQNVGVVLGLCSGGLADVDLDCLQALRIASSVLLGTGAAFGRAGKSRSHRLYSVGTVDGETGEFKPERCVSEKLLDPTDGATLVELRGDPIDPDKGPLQTVFPGSTHPSGEAIEWAEDGDLAVIREIELRRQVRQLAAVALIAKHWPAGPHKDTDGAAVAGGRHDANLKVAGWLTRCGWSPDRVAQFLELVSIAAGADPEKAKRRALGSDAAARAQAGDRLYGWPAVVELFGQKVIDRAAEWLGVGRPAEAEPWPEPEELSEADEPQPFPLEALPPNIAAAVVEYQACGGQPIEMVVTAAIAAMSGCVQGLVDVRRDSQLVGPVSLNTLVIADSGERKTTCDNAFSAAAERWARSEQKRIAPLYMEAKEMRDAHQAEKQGLISALRDASAKGKRAKGAAKDDAAADIDTLQNQLREHGRKLQPLPPQPTPRVENGTKEGVENVLRSAWPSVAWASSEGANVTGGHGFKDDALLRTLAFLNSRWDGAPIDRARSAEDYSRIYGRRVSVSLMLQPAAFEAFTRAGAGLARGIGNLARTLLVWPRSTMGTRFRDENGADPELPALGAFLERAEELYRTPLSMPFDMECMEFGTDEKGAPAPDQLELAPLELALSAEARRLWIRYQNDCEAQLPAEGELADVRDVAAKSAENACRLAALFHVWEHGPTGAINSMDMDRGVAVARWFLYEARRVLCCSADHAGAGDAELLARWVASCPEPPSLKDALRLAPYRLRHKARRDAAIAYLVEKYWLRRGQRAGKTVLVLNPALPWEA